MLYGLLDPSSPVDMTAQIEHTRYKNEPVPMWAFSTRLRAAQQLDDGQQRQKSCRCGNGARLPTQRKAGPIELCLQNAVG
jgi:hypothetical protein